jgi:hypothetical protein
MRRDLNLCAHILEVVEEKCSSGGLTPIDLEGVEPDVIDVHLQLLNEAGFIQAELVRNVGGSLVRSVAIAGKLDG